jgi:predicted nucleic acid-binding protein
LIVLDTNVVSELLRPVPDARTLQWVDAQSADALWLCSVVTAELLYGVARLPDGRRKQQLAQAMQTIIHEDFDLRVLPFDLEASLVYADIVARQENLGQSVSMADAQIAATCLRHDATLATRNVRDFGGLGVTLINPWIAID